MFRTTAVFKFLVFIFPVFITVNAAECGSPIQFAPSYLNKGSQPHRYMIPTPDAANAFQAAIQHLVDHPQDLYALLTISYKGQPIWQLQRKAFEAQNTSHTKAAYDSIYEQCFHPGTSGTGDGGSDVCPKAVYNTGVWYYEGQWFWAAWWPFNAGGGERRECSQVERVKRDAKMARRGQLAGGIGKEGGNEGDMVILSVEKKYVRIDELPYSEMFTRRGGEPKPTDPEQFYHAGWVEVDFPGVPAG